MLVLFIVVFLVSASPQQQKGTREQSAIIVRAVTTADKGAGEFSAFCWEPTAAHEAQTE